MGNMERECGRRADRLPRPHSSSIISALYEHRRCFKLIIIFEHVCPQQVAGVCVPLKPPATERIRSLQWKCDEIEVFSLNYDNGLDSDTGSQ